MRRPHGIVAAAGGLLAIALGVGCQPAPTMSWDLQLLSSRPDGAAGGTTSNDAHFSPSGTLVVFGSAASDLGPTDTNGRLDTYVRDLTSGEVTLVSANAARTDSGNGESASGRFMPDGRIVFISDATDLTASPGGPGSQAYAFDLTTGETTLVTSNAVGGGLTNDGAPASINPPTFSADGTKVLFETTADDLGPTDTDDQFDIYLRDLTTGATTLISPGSDFEAGSFSATFSPDGTRVVYSNRSGVDPRDTNGLADLYAYDVATDTTRLLSVDVTGTQAGDLSTPYGGTFSPDGRRIVFSSEAGNLVATDTNGVSDLFVVDVASGAISLVSVNAAGTDSGDSVSSPPSLKPAVEFSADGTRVLFISGASDLVAVGDTNGVADAFVRDMAAGTTILVSTDSTGVARSAWNADLSPDGSFVAFTTPTAIPGTVDTNHDVDLYARDLAGGPTSLVTHNADGTDGTGGMAGVVEMSPTGRQIVFDTLGTGMGPPDDNNEQDVYLATIRQADLALTLTAEPSPVTSGATVTYRTTVANDGDAAVGTTVTIRAPDGTNDAHLSTTAGTCDAVAAQPNLFVCAFGTLAPGTHATVVLTARVTASPGSTLVAVALASATTADPHPNDNVAVIETPVTA